MEGKIKIKDKHGNESEHIVKDNQIYDKYGTQKIGTIEESSSTGSTLWGIIIAFLIVFVILIAPFTTLKHLPGWGIALFLLSLSSTVYLLIDSIIQFAKERNVKEKLIMIFSIVAFSLIYIIYSICVFVITSGKTEEYLASTNVLIKPLVAFMVFSLIFNIVFTILKLIHEKITFKKHSKVSLIRTIIVSIISFSTLLTGCIGSKNNSKQDTIENKIDFNLVLINKNTTGVSLSYGITNYTSSIITYFKNVLLLVYCDQVEVCHANFYNIETNASLTYGDSFLYTFTFYYSKGQANQSFWNVATKDVTLKTYSSVSY